MASLIINRYTKQLRKTN